MDIYLIGMKRTDRVLDFERFAQSKGCDVRAACPSAEAVLKLNGKPAGIVVFDDGEASVGEWLAKIRESTRYLSLPLVAVSTRTESDLASRLLAAGASVVCGTGSTNDSILQEVMTHCYSEPVIDEMRKSLVGPFCDAAVMTMRDMASLNVVVRATYQKTRYKMFGDISAVIGLMAKTEGALVVSFPEPMAMELSRRVLKGVVDEPVPDMVRDCIGEVANVIAGQARGMLAGTPYQFAMSTPTVVSGAGHEIRHKPGMPCLVAAFGSGEGEFALQICLGV